MLAPLWVAARWCSIPLLATSSERTLSPVAQAAIRRVRAPAVRPIARTPHAIICLVGAGCRMHSPRCLTRMSTREMPTATEALACAHARHPPALARRHQWKSRPLLCRAQVQRMRGHLCRRQFPGPQEEEPETFDRQPPPTAAVSESSAAQWTTSIGTPRPPAPLLACERAISTLLARLM